MGCLAGAGGFLPMSIIGSYVERLERIQGTQS